MSNIFQYLVRDTNGVLPVNIGSGPITDPVTQSQGLLLDETGAVYCVLDETTPEATLYVNAELTGGSDINNPPTNHGNVFSSTTATPTAIGDGFFQWEFNAEEATGRGNLVYDIGANNPDLDVGTTYRISYECTKINAGTYTAALSTTAFSNLTIVGSDVVAVGGATRVLHIDFRVESAGYTGLVRFGCGTTANNDSHLIYRYPQLEIFVGARQFALSFDENSRLLVSLSPAYIYSQAIPYNDLGAMCIGTDASPISFYDQGLAFTSSGLVATDYDASGGGVAPAQVQNLVLTSGDHSILAQWDAQIPPASPPISGYKLEYKLASSGVWTVVNLGAVLSYSIGSLTAGELYDVRVSAVNAVGEGPPSTVQQATPQELPAQVQNLVLTPTDGQIQANWNAISPDPFPTLTGYRLEYRAGTAGPYTGVDLGLVTTFDILGLTNGQSYEVRVAGVNSFGQGAFSTVQTSTPVQTPLQVTNLQLTPDDMSIDASWDGQTRVPAILSYVVNWKLNSSGIWTNQVNVGLALNYTIGGLTNGQLYDVRVAAINSVGQGPWSDVEQATPNPQAIALVMEYREAGLDPQTNGQTLISWSNTGTTAGQNDFTVVTGTPQVNQAGFDQYVQFGGNNSVECVNQGAALTPPYTIYVAGINFFVPTQGAYWFQGVNGVNFRMSQTQFILEAGATLAFNQAPNNSALALCVQVNGASSRIVCQGGLSFDTTGNAGTQTFSPSTLAWDNAKTASAGYNGQFYEMEVYNGLHDSSTIYNTLADIRARYGF